MSFTIATTHAKTSVRNSKTIIKMNIMNIINYGLMVSGRIKLKINQNLTEIY